ncbi:hypothetical protein RHMOL_Rhmol01G0298900 [Rhododendron molle]|uniref:Uncharacterized protein n=1 Tax=Rhododendron molle TaxID=49168 RepID=A0ACC0Q7L3_RHOML|nr:hypothetical protein RHMOL_Rhmol01G0298900 [Rhododendron molle]
MGYIGAHGIGALHRYKYSGWIIPWSRNTSCSRFGAVSSTFSLSGCRKCSI